MTDKHSPKRLYEQLAQLIAQEAAIEQSLEKLLPKVAVHVDATALLAGFQTISNDHRKALETRLEAITENGYQVKDSARGVAANGLSEEERYPVSAALQIIYTMLNQAVFGYAVLHSLATRFKDSNWIADDGTSLHLARQHTPHYVQAIQQISRLLHEVVLWELDEEGLECQCVCPACGVGICLCSLAGRSFLSETWAEAGPIAVDEGIYVQLPKKNSAATKAGLRKGDTILAAGGKEIEFYGEIQGVVRGAEAGEEIQLRVRREADETEEIALVHP